MSTKFQADADLNEHIIDGVLRIVPEIDIRTSNQARLEGLNDPSVLAIAAENDRVLLTHDRRTMPRHFGDFIVTTSSPGVILVPKVTQLGPVIDAIILIWAASDASEYNNRLVDLRRFMS